METTSERGESTGLGRSLSLRDFARSAKADNPRHVQGPAAQTTLMPAAIDAALELRLVLTTHIKRANALGAIQLVRAEGQQIDTITLNVDIDLAYRLRRICVKQRAAAMGNLT